MSEINKLLLKASFFGTFSESMWLPLYAIFVQRVGGSIIDAGIGFAIFNITTGIVVIAMGKSKFFSDHLHAFVFWGFLISGLGDLLLVTVVNKWELFAVQALIGITVGVLGPAWDAIYSEEDGQTNAEKWSIWSGGVTLFSGIAALLSGIIVHFSSFKAMFLIMFIVNCYAVFCAYKVWDSQTKEFHPAMVEL